MSSKIDPQHLSSFGRLAVKLDADLGELTRLSAQIQRLDLETDSDLDHSVKLLGKFADIGRDISVGIQDFSRILQEARDKSEGAIQLVAERAELIRQRKQRQKEVREQLSQVEQNVRATNE